MARTVAGSPPALSRPDCTIRAMAGSGPTIQIPRWIQLVVLPVALLLAFLLASTLGHVLFLFLTASVIAFTLNPLVRDLTRLRVPRAPSVLIVYTIFLAVVSALLIAIGASRSTRRGTPRIASTSTSPRTSRQPDRCRAGHRPAAGLARRPRARADSDAQQVNDWLGRAERGRGLKLRAERHLVRPGAAFSVVVLLSR